MFSKIDKAIVAAVASWPFAGMMMANSHGGEWMHIAAMVAVPGLVWIFPNKKP